MEKLIVFFFIKHYSGSDSFGAKKKLVVIFGTAQKVLIYTLPSDLVTVTAAHRRSDDRRSSQKSKGNWRKKEATFSIKFSFRIE